MKTMSKVKVNRVERTNPTSISQEASGVGSPHVIPTDSMGEALGVGPTNDVQMDPVVGSAASSSSQPNRDQPSVPLEPRDALAESVSDVIGPMSVFRDASDPDPNLTAQNNLRSLMADLSSVPLEGQPPPEPVSVTAEPDAEPTRLQLDLSNSCL